MPETLSSAFSASIAHSPDVDGLVGFIASYSGVRANREIANALVRAALSGAPVPPAVFDRFEPVPVAELQAFAARPWATCASDVVRLSLTLLFRIPHLPDPATVTDIFQRWQVERPADAAKFCEWAFASVTEETADSHLVFLLGLFSDFPQFARGFARIAGFAVFGETDAFVVLEVACFLALGSAPKFHCAADLLSATARTLKRVCANYERLHSSMACSYCEVAALQIRNSVLQWNGAVMGARNFELEKAWLGYLRYALFCHDSLAAPIAQMIEARALFPVAGAGKQYAKLANEVIREVVGTPGIRRCDSETAVELWTEAFSFVLEQPRLVFAGIKPFLEFGIGLMRSRLAFPVMPNVFRILYAMGNWEGTELLVRFFGGLVEKSPKSYSSVEFSRFINSLDASGDITGKLEVLKVIAVGIGDRLSEIAEESIPKLEEINERVATKFTDELLELFLGACC
jgi:hypothetical protein